VADGAPAAELSSISTLLDDLARRVTAIAERSSGTEADWLATDLFQVERSLGEARRRLQRITERLPGRD
jgi:hypothetical protein